MRIESKIKKFDNFVKHYHANQAIEMLAQIIRDDHDHEEIRTCLLKMSAFYDRKKNRPADEPEMAARSTEAFMNQENLHLIAPIAAGFLLHFPDEAWTHRLMARFGLRCKDFDRTEKHIRHALHLEPGDIDDLFVLYKSLRSSGKTARAREILNQCLALKPENQTILLEGINFGFEVRDYDSGKQIGEQLIKINPEHVEGYVNLGIIYLATGDYHLARERLEKAIELQPNHEDALDAVTKVYLEFGEFEKALSCVSKAVRLNPRKGIVRSTLSHIQLLTGNWTEGFSNYRARYDEGIIGGVKFVEHKGEMLETLSQAKNKTILVHWEQGFGDTLNFCRFLTDLASVSKKVYFHVQMPLSTLNFDFPENVEVITDKPEGETYDYKVPLMNLPYLTKLRSSEVPYASGYIKVSEQYDKKWKRILGTKSTPRIGLTWSGGTSTRHDRKRTIPLEQFVQMLPEGFEYVSLQKEVRDYDQEFLKSQDIIRHFGPQLDSFADTAAIASQLDLVVAVDTSIVHLCGALGIPTWCLIHNRPDFRWMLEREDTPWYDSVRLIRQTKSDHWDDVFTKVKKDLEGMFSSGQRKSA